MSIRGGILYNFHGTRIDRATNPLDTPGTIDWRSMDTPVFANGQSSGGTVKDGAMVVVYSRRTGVVAGTSAELWAYEDQMASVKPTITSPGGNTTVTVDPVTGRADSFTLALNAMGSGNGLASSFDVEIAEAAVGWSGATRGVNIIVTSPVAPQIAIPASMPAGFTMKANTVYQLRTRANNEVAGDAINSMWSDPINLSVSPGSAVTQTQYGPILLGPQGGAVNVSTTPGFSWTPQYGAAKYKFTLATDAAMTKTVAGTPATVTSPSYQAAAALANDTTYFWSVQVIDPTAGPISVGTFTTMSKPAPVVTAAPTFSIPPITIPQPTVIIPTQAAPIITIPAQAPAQPAIPQAAVWAIIIIGAVLVIAVIVLIVRTRRVP